ncbi:hypothetical protein A0J61_00257 [Choanephora cucurbitarum]|uniref:Uncharacterized protein n=1 Tax=Choanephora cucurbitarum TaxID=101091 RepID=A0A1C7NRH9_9FUNG|nr:hypothetical protein A0J61_00257 [Choanephora cucurbitarum]
MNSQTTKDRLASESRDLLAIRDLLDVYCQKVVDKELPSATSDLRRKRVLLEPKLKESMDKIISSLAECLSIVDFEGDIDSTSFNRTEPVDENLKQKVKDKQQELDNTLSKAIEMRNTYPKKQLNIALEICAAARQEIDKVEYKIVSQEQSTIDTIEVTDNTVEAYRDAIRLSKNIIKKTQYLPEKIETILDILE